MKSNSNNLKSINIDGICYNISSQAIMSAKEIAQKDVVEIVNKYAGSKINENSYILEVGSGLGYVAQELSKISNNVYALEPRVHFANYAVKANLVKEEKMLNCTLQDIDANLYDKFDCVVAFDWLICPKNDRDEYFNKLSKVVKRDGIVIISSSYDFYFQREQVYKSGDNIRDCLKGNFQNCDIKTNDCLYDKYSAVATSPVRISDFDTDISGQVQENYDY